MSENVSSLLDGELERSSAVHAFNALKRDGALREDWDAYCLIGDVLREEPLLSTDFTHNVMAALSSEPTVLAPVARAESEGWTRHLMSIAASVMGVAAVGWVALTMNGEQGAEGLKMAGQKAPAVALASAKSQAPIRIVADKSADETTDREYVFAHQAMAPSTAMPGVAMYVRTVSDNGVVAAR